MNDKLQESARYLKCFNNIENETFGLYETLSKKINPPESSFILGLAYDSLKCAKIIQGILDYIDLPETENTNNKKNLVELANKISRFSRKLSRTNNLNPEVSCEILKELTNMEERISEIYNNYLQSPSIKIVADEFSKLAVNLSNFKKIFETFVEQKQKHRETLIEINYCIEAKEAEKFKNVPPTVKYQNPDTWNHESTLHTFVDTQVKENVETQNSN